MERENPESRSRAPIIRRRLDGSLKWARAQWRRNPRARAAVIGLLIVGVVGMEAWSSFSPPVSPEVPRYLVARRTLQAGEPIHGVDFSMAARDQPVSGGLTDQDLHLLRGARANREVARGDVLKLTSVDLSPLLTGMARAVPRGHRAYLVTTNFPVPAMPGDRVDVLLTPAAEGVVPEVVAENALVLHARGRAGFGETLVAVPAGRIPWLEKAQQHGKLTLVLRNPKEASRTVDSGRPGWWMQNRGRQPAIPVWEE